MEIGEWGTWRETDQSGNKLESGPRSLNGQDINRDAQKEDVAALKLVMAGSSVWVVVRAREKEDGLGWESAEDSSGKSTGFRYASCRPGHTQNPHLSPLQEEV